MNNNEIFLEAARKAFEQASEGYEVELTEELADAMGAYVEDAITEDDLDDVFDVENEEVSDGQN